MSCEWMSGSVKAGIVLVLVAGSTANAQELERASTPAGLPGVGIVGVKHVGVPVRDQDSAVAFYTTALGFELAVDEAMGSGRRWIELRIPGSPTRVLLLASPRIENRAGAFTNIVFLSHDVTASYEAMRARGVAFDMPPTDLPGGGMNAVFRDPDGNTFALATPDGAVGPVPSGEWSAILREPDGRAVSFVAEVVSDGAGTGVTFVIQGAHFPLTDVHASVAGMRFTWNLDPGPLVLCRLARRADGAFEGDCVDRDEGDAKRLTLRPPVP